MFCGSVVVGNLKWNGSASRCFAFSTPAGAPDMVVPTFGKATPLALSVETYWGSTGTSRMHADSDFITRLTRRLLS